MRSAWRAGGPAPHLASTLEEPRASHAQKSDPMRASSEPLGAPAESEVWSCINPHAQYLAKQTVLNSEQGDRILVRIARETLCDKDRRLRVLAEDRSADAVRGGELPCTRLRGRPEKPARTSLLSPPPSSPSPRFVCPEALPERSANGRRCLAACRSLRPGFFIFTGRAGKKGPSLLKGGT